MYVRRILLSIFFCVWTVAVAVATALTVLIAMVASAGSNIVSTRMLKYVRKNIHMANVIGVLQKQHRIFATETIRKPNVSTDDCCHLLCAAVFISISLTHKHTIKSKLFEMLPPPLMVCHESKAHWPFNTCFKDSDWKFDLIRIENPPNFVHIR